jgi:sulfur carrier protein ThiS
VRIQLKLGAVVAEKVRPPGTASSLELPGNATPGDVVAHLGLGHVDDLVILRNGRAVELDEELSEGDEIMVMYALCGG